MLDTQSAPHHSVRLHDSNPVLGNFSEAQTGVCHLENITGIVLEKVVEYFYYNEKYRNSEGVPDMDIPSELCLELLMAADYLST
jgi:transcription elongation factor B subunit 1